MVFETLNVLREGGADMLLELSMSAFGWIVLHLCGK